MNVVATAILLIVTLLAVPLLSYFFGTPLGPLEWAALRSLVAIVLGAWMLEESLDPNAYAGFALLALGLVIIDGRAVRLIDRSRRAG